MRYFIYLILISPLFINAQIDYYSVGKSVTDELKKQSYEREEKRKNLNEEYIYLNKKLNEIFYETLGRNRKVDILVKAVYNTANKELNNAYRLLTSGAMKTKDYEVFIYYLKSNVTSTFNVLEKMDSRIYNLEKISNSIKVRYKRNNYNSGFEYRINNGQWLNGLKYRMYLSN